MRTAQTMMVDERRRITIEKDLVDKYGKEYFVIDGFGRIVLIPKPKNPIKGLQEWGRKIGIDKIPLEKIGKIAEEEAYKEIDEELRKRAKRGAR